MKVTFGERLKFIRAERGLSQDEFAALLGTSKQVISRYETGQRTPKITIAKAYADKLNVPLSYLLCDDSAEMSATPLAEQQFPLSPEEVSLIAKYRALPPAVQDIVSEMVDREYEKISPASDNISNVG